MRKPGIEITLQFGRGAFTCEEAAESVGDGHSRSRAAEQAFISAMTELQAKSLRCNVHKGQANYAPKFLREKTKAASSYSQDELAAAMNRLIREGKISIEEDGPPSRRRTYLVIVSPPLPGSLT